MRYIDGYAIPVPKKNLKAHTRTAATGANIWMRHGALDYKECVSEELTNTWGMTFSQIMKLEPHETVVFSYIAFKSRAHRDRVNAKVIKEMEKMRSKKEIPFDVSRMVYCGFNVLADV